MGNQAFMYKSTRILTAILIASAPFAATAGSYGTAGVSDDKVGRATASADTVWCERIEARVSRTLFAQMDCGDTVGASSAVAGERITNGRRTLKDFFTVKRNGPVKDPKESDDPDSPIRVVPNEPDDDNPSNEPVGKWDRLEDFGINRDNLFDQDSNTFEQIKDFANNTDHGGDWSGFDLD